MTPICTTTWEEPILTYNFDKAIESFNTFISKGGKEDGDDLPAKRLIEMCENAKNLIPLRVNVTIQNMGEAINTPFPDYFPFIDENESVLYFTTKRDKNSPAVTDIDGFKTADIYFSEFNGETWSKAKECPILSIRHILKKLSVCRQTAKPC